MITYRVTFADGGRVDLPIDAVSVNSGWDVATRKATACTYDGKPREVRRIEVLTPVTVYGPEWD